MDRLKANDEAADVAGVTTLASQGGITFLGTVIGRLIEFGFLVVVANLVAPSTFGLYSLGLAVVLFTKAIGDMSLHRAIDYFVPRYIDDGAYGKARYVLISAIVLSLVGTVLLASLLWLSADELATRFGEPQLVNVLPILAIALPLLAFRDVAIRLFISLKRLKYRVYLSNLIQSGTKFTITFLLLLVGFGLGGLLAGYVVSLVITAVVALFLIFRDATWVWNRTFERTPLRDILSYSLPLTFAGVVYATVSQIDLFVLGYFPNTGAKDIAIFKVSFLLAGNLPIFLYSLSPVFKPLIAEVRGEPALLSARYALATRWILLLTLPIAITLAASPDTYLAVLFTEQYALGSTVLMILVAGYLVNAGVGPEGMVLEGLGYTRLTLFNTILMVGTNALLDVLLVPRIGIVGAAIGTAVAISVAVTAGVLEIRYFVGILPYQRGTVRIVAPAVPAGVMALVVVPLFTSPLLLAVTLPILVCSTYLAGLVLVGAFGPEDRVVAGLIDERLGTDLVSRLIPE